MSLLRSLGSSHLLFSERDQAVYEVDRLSADVWRALDGGADADSIVSGIVAAGADPQSAHAAVHERLAQLSPFWTRRESLADAALAEDHFAPMRDTVDDGAPHLVLEIAGVAVRLDLPAALYGQTLGTFGHMRSERAAADVLLRARLVGDDVELAGAEGLSMCRAEEFLPALKMQLIGAILRCAAYELALHSGAFVRDDRVMLLVGSPGAGKTTLGIALSRSGWEVDADDVTLMDGDGRVSGIPLPFAAKSGSWPLLSRFFPDGFAGPAHRRPDGQLVRFIAPEKWSPPRPRSVATVVVLNRGAAGRTRVEDIDPALAFKALLAEADSHNHRLSASGFSGLISALRGSRCIRLSYSDFANASGALGDLCS